MKKFFTIIFLCLLISFAQADTYIPVSSEIYNNLRRLEALGFINSGQLTTLPLSIKEVNRLIKEAETLANKDSLAVKLIDNIKRELPSDNFAINANLNYKYTENNSTLINKNNSDIDTEKGSNLLLSTDIYATYDNFGFRASPYFTSNEKYEKVSFNELYAMGTYKKLEFSLGKENQWWGGGQNGSILLSNNAEGLNVFKISNSTPYEFLIPFRFTFFISKLENNRLDVKSPYINGVRLTLKPSKYLEIGLSKTALYGGRGRDNSFSAFVDSFIGNKEKNTTSNINKEPGDQRAGFDFKLISPNSIQPFTFYLEAIGEDVSDDFPYPYKYAFIYSLYLPKVLSFNNLELLIEHADTVFRQNVWYRHHIFTQGYTYNGDIIGHYIGGNAKDWFVKATYNFSESKLNLSYERYRKYSPNFVWESYMLSFQHNLTQKFSYSLETALSNEDKAKMLISVGLQYKF